MIPRFAGIAALLLVSLASPSFARPQSCGGFTPEFTGGGFEQVVYDFELHDAGSGPKLFAAGAFRAAGSVSARRVAQWDGTSWSALGEGLNSEVFELASVDLGTGPQLYAAGRFQSSGGAPCARIARWDGTDWVALGAGLNYWAWSICEYPTPAGNRLVVGGEFTSAGGQTALRVAQWDGTSWTPLGTGLGILNQNARVASVVMHDDGSGPALYAGGDFAGRIARWDGTNWSLVGGGLAGIVLSLASYDDGQGHRYLLAGGNFAGGATSVLKGWDGSSWQDLGFSNFSGSVDRIFVKQESAGPAAYLAGSFQPLPGATTGAEYVARWTPGSITTYPSLEGRAYATCVHDDGSGSGPQLFVGGDFQLDPDATRPDLAGGARWVAGRWEPIEAPRHALYRRAPQLASENALLSWTNPLTGERDLYVGGDFSGSADDPAVSNLARWDGQAFHAVPAPFAGWIRALGQWRPTLASAPQLVITGAGGTWSFDGAQWTRLGTPSPVEARVLIEFVPTGASAPLLFAFGEPLGLPGPPSGMTAAKFDGTAWSPLTAPPNERIYAAVEWDAPGPTPRGIYVGGMFFGAGTTVVHGVAFFDGTNFFPTATHDFSDVYRLCVWDDGTGEKLYAATTAGLRCFDGTSWSVLGPTAGLLVPFDDGSGPALYLNDRQRWRNGAVETFSAAPSVAPDKAACAHVWVDEQGTTQGLYFGGLFRSQGDVPALGLARYWNPCGFVRTYCSPKVSSNGCSPSIGWTGIPSLSSSITAPFKVTASNVLNQSTGLFFFGASGRNNLPHLGGTLCVRTPLVRTPVRASGGSLGAPDCSGTFELDFTPFFTGTPSQPVSVGHTLDGQWWFRDPAASFSAGLTDALEFLVNP